jgi:glutathione S-transferase
VNDVISELGIEVEERDIADPETAADLVARGGKKQVPYLVDDARGVEMYESEDIIAYLREHYSPR